MLQPWDWTPTYLAAIDAAGLTIRLDGDVGGTCPGAAMFYGMELRGILQGLPTTRLSDLDVNYRYRLSAGQIGSHSVGSDLDVVVAIIRNSGACREDLHPISLCQSGPDQPYAGLDAVPSAAAVADRANHLLLEYEELTPQSQDEMIAMGQAALAAGYPIVFSVSGAGHDLCAMGFDFTDFRGLDSKSPSRVPFQRSYADLWGSGHGALLRVIKSVSFNGGSVISPPPGDLPVTQAQLDAIQTAFNLRSWDALVAPLAAIGITPPPVVVDPPPTGGYPKTIGWQATATAPNGDLWFVNDHGLAMRSPIGGGGLADAGLYVSLLTIAADGTVTAIEKDTGWSRKWVAGTTWINN